MYAYDMGFDKENLLAVRLSHRMSKKTIIVHLFISSKELKLQDVVIMTDSIPFYFLIHTYILFHCMMTVQMVLCNIQDCRYLWCKLINRFQLKTADFCNSYRIWLHLQCFGSIWGSDIADYKNRLTCIG